MALAKLVKFALVVATDGYAEVLVNPDYIVTITDGSPFAQKEVTLICMTSGEKFYVKHSYAEVKEKILSNFNTIVV